jgi:hypothetical protein
MRAVRLNDSTGTPARTAAVGKPNSGQRHYFVQMPVAVGDPASLQVQKRVENAPNGGQFPGGDRSETLA